MWHRTQRATSEAARQSPTSPTTTRRPIQQQQSAPEAYEVHRIGDLQSASVSSSHSEDPDVWLLPHSSLSSNSSSEANSRPPSSLESNPSATSYSSSSRQRHQREIATTYFGPSSQATDIFFETDQEDVDNDASFHDYYSHDSEDEDEYPSSSMRASTTGSRQQQQQSADSRDSQRPQERVIIPPEAEETQANSAEDAAARRRHRKENQKKFKDLVRLADAHRPVSLSTFTRKSSRKLARNGSKHSVTEADRKLNTELFEAYVAYARSIGHEPQIDIDDESADSGDEGGVTGRVSLILERPVVEEHVHVWTDYLGTRHSKRRGCIQFWVWLLIGVIVGIIMALFLAHLSLNEVLHLDAFVEQNVVVTDDFAYLYLRDEVSFRIKYDIQSQLPSGDAAATPGNESFFQVLLLTEDDFEDYVEGKPFNYVAEGSTLRTTYASLPLTRIANDDEMYFVVQPCVLPRNPEVDYCQTRQLPTPVDSGKKVYKLNKPAATTSDSSSYHGLVIKRLYVNPMPDHCSASGWKGGSYLLIFLPFIIVALFGLRVFQMLYRCESFRANLERNYKKEFDVPEDEVDYWQPMPWDRKVPKTRLLGPCCWKKMRKPFEPFYTWWRHENYFTWIFFPYRNERLSMSERAIIIFCSLYLTFYVLFVLVMLRDNLGDKLSLFASVVIYYVLIMILPSLGKAIFKEIFKLIFRQRRKYFRVQAVGGDTSGFSFRLAFFLQFLVAVLIALTQGPMFYIWLYRSCTFLKQFMYFGLLAAVTRLSILGLVMDYSWYLVIKTWGWKDLCPYCTERLVHCDCFNDEMLVLAVERVGPKWELILLLDELLAKQKGYTAQFDQYTTDQLRERWQIVVDRAEVHMEKLEKLRAYQEKKRVDRLRRERQRQSFLNAASFLSFRENTHNPSEVKHDGDGVGEDDDGDVASKHNSHKKKHARESQTEEEDGHPDDCMDIGCSLREKKVLALNSKIKLDKFEKHYDSTIVDVFHSIQHSLSKRRRHARRALRRQQQQRQGRHEEGGDGESRSDAEETGDERGGSNVFEDDRRDTISVMSSSRGESGGSSSSSGGGETMWVYDDPQQRLERREREKLRRKRAFRVLDDYFIESIEQAHDEQGHLHYVVAPESGSRQTALPAPGSSSTSTAAPPTSTSARPAAAKSLQRRDSKYLPLLSRKKSIPREEDVVVVVSEDVSHSIPITVHEDDGECSDSADENDADDFDGRASDRSVYSQGGATTDQQQPPPSRTYAVMERHPSLLRRVSSSASTFASWVFKYDKDSEA